MTIELNYLFAGYVLYGMTFCLLLYENMREKKVSFAVYFFGMMIIMIFWPIIPSVLALGKYRKRRQNQ
jgi:cytochrome c biogenesis factor